MPWMVVRELAFGGNKENDNDYPQSYHQYFGKIKG